LTMGQLKAHVTTSASNRNLSLRCTRRPRVS
jgi:hypothetical protein